MLALSEALKSEAYQTHLHVHVGLAKVVLKSKRDRGKLEPKIKISKPTIELTDIVQQNPPVTAKVASYKEQMLKDFENPSLNWLNESVETKPHFACNTNFDISTDARPRDRDTRAGINLAPYDEIEMRINQRRSSASLNNETALHESLQRQGRNEYINLASQIAYDGQNIAFIFYENQICRLINESPYDERRLEVLRASCVGQPREMVNLFCAPMKNITTSQRIEKALGRLRQRYSVSGGLTSEPKIIAIRNGIKVAFNATSMKTYNEDLNTLEVYAFSHDEVDKLSGQLLIDTVSLLPNLLKRRNLDYLDKKGLNMSRPGFDSLRDFVAHEIDMMTSEYAQTFFKSDNKEQVQSSGSKTYRVRQTTFGPEKRTKSDSLSTSSNPALPAKHENSAANVKTSDDKRAKDKPAPTCFVCMRPELKHFVADCEVFKSYSDKLKRQTVMDAKRCLNCLSVEHFVRDFPHPSKCRKCIPSLSE